MGAILALWALLIAAVAAPATAARWDKLASTVFHSFGREQGLPHPALTALAQDRQGFIWIGTQGGLARWDGYRFHAWRADIADAGALPDDYIQTLHVDPAGRLWVGTGGGGLARYDSARDRFMRMKLGLAKGRINIGAIADDGRGGLWIGWQEGLLHLDPATGKVSTIETLLPRGARPPQGRIRTILHDRAGGLWIGTREGLSRHAAGAAGFTPIAFEAGGTGRDQISALFEDSQGRIWIGTEQHGLYVIDRTGAAARPIGGAASAAHGFVSAITAAGHNEIWAGLRGGGGIIAVNRTTGAVRSIRRDLNRDHSLADNDVWALLRDRDGSVWAGTGSGLSYSAATSGRFVTLFGGSGRRGGLSSTAILSILPTRDGHVWVSYSEGGADRIDPVSGEILHLAPDAARPESALPADLLFAIAEGDDGTIWFGTRRGLYARNPGTGAIRLVRIPGRESHVSVADLAFHDGILWIGGEEDGLRGLDIGSGRLVFGPKESAGLSDQGMRIIRPGPGPFLWIGTRDGLDRLHLPTGRIAQIRSGAAGGMPGRNINSLTLDRKGRLWVGSFGGGLTMISDWGGSQPRFRHYGTAEGLPHVNVDGVRTDGDGVVWISTDDGLARVDPDSLAIKGASHADGVFLIEYSAGASAATAQGEVLFGATGGLTVVRPGRLQPWRLRPSIVVTDIRSGGQSVPVGPFNEAGATATIEVRPDANGLAVEFAALDYSSPERNHYAYRLEGYDSDWIETDASRRLAIYTNLPPGDYVLRLRGSNRAGLWSAEDRALRVQVHPAWYQRIWFKLAAGLLAILAIAGLVSWRTALLRHRQGELERQIAERTADLRAAMERLGQLATIDPLTACANRWYFIEQARDAIAREGEQGVSVSLIVLDIDNFKQVNDSFGHPVGDAVLAKAGEVLHRLARPDDLIGRMGGEEFALLLTDVSGPVARTFAEALREAIGEGKVAPQGEAISVTASLGVAEMRAGDDFETLYARADRALYAAKNAGRNRVELAD